MKNRYDFVLISRFICILYLKSYLRLRNVQKYIAIDKLPNRKPITLMSKQPMPILNILNIFRNFVS